MSNQYAIEIQSGATGVTDVTFGCVAGDFRFITGSPNYVSTPPYPLWEDWSPNTYVWFEGFITKDGISNPNRQVDISITGDYGVLSGLNFTIKNTEKFWNFVKTNSIYLVNKTVKFYVIISDTFFQVWQGVISNNPMDEVNYQFQCTDEFKKIHKNFPPETITYRPYGSDVDQSKTLPVIIGDVPYALLTKIDDIAEQWRILNIKDAKNYDTAAATSYTINKSLYSSGKGYCLKLATQGVEFLVDDLVDTFLVATTGDGAVNDKIIRILHNDRSIWTTTSPYYNYTNVYLSEPLQVTTPTTFNATAQHYDMVNPSSDVNHVGSTSDTWWFKIFTLDLNFVSSSGIVKYEDTKLRAWNSDKKKFDDVSELIEYDGNTQDLKVITNDVNQDGSVVVTTRIPITIKKVTYDAKWITDGGWSTGTSHFDVPDSELKYFSDCRRNITAYVTGDIPSSEINQPKSVAIRAIIDPSNFVDMEKYDNIYIGMDLALKNPYAVTWYYELTVRDIYGYPVSELSVTKSMIYPSTQCSASTWTDFNFLSNEYYRSNTSTLVGDDKSLFGEVQTLDGSDAVVFSVLELSSELVDAIKAKSITEIDVRFSFTQSQKDLTTTYIKIKEIGFLGSNKVETFKGDLYVKAYGISDLDDDGLYEYTDNVYNVFRYFLHKCDGLLNTQIDYGNLPTTRNAWLVGRRCEEKKTTFEYLQELCRQSFVCLFPGRTGKRMLSAWREDTSTPIVHDENTIVRDSIKSWTKTKILDLYNSFTLKYNFNLALNDFERTISISNVDKPYFPEFFSIDPIWTTYFSGLDNSSYQEAKALWEICHQSYLRANVVAYKLPDDVLNLNYYIDPGSYSNNLNAFKGVKSSPYLFLKNLVEWTSRQKDEVTYNLPLNSIQVKNELCDPVYFSDTIYTNNTTRKGWIKKIEIDTKKDQIITTVVLEPSDIINVEDSLYVETGNSSNTITESGSQTDQIIEG